MKTKINIPTPCSEDWNQMSPTDKGAFCQKCAFEVIDFTNQSPEEIRETLKQRSGQRTCGHISKSQLELVNTDFHLWENQTLNVFRSKFLYACVMVFGLGLFSSCNGSNDDDLIEGEIEHVEDVGMIEEDTISGDTVCTDLIDGMMESTTGEMDVIEEGE